jgi:hypothetical protein
MLHKVNASWLGPWKRLLGALLAALALLPVPAAMATLTFSGSWTPIISTVGGPTPPTPTFSDITNNAQQVDDLTVNMGTYQGSTALATSSIELTRPITLSTSNQSIRFTQQFISQFTQAGESVTVKVKNSSGATVLTPITSNRSFNATTTLQESDLTLTNVLAKGTYTLDVKVVYNTTNKLGGWKTKSPHQFEFKGL